MDSLKSNAAFYWVLIVVALSVGIFVYLIKEDQPGTLAIMGVTSFQDTNELGESIVQNLSQKISRNEFYWIGIEPGKNEHLTLAGSLIRQLKAHHTFASIIVDQELSLSAAELAELSATDVIGIKANLYKLGETLQMLEKTHSSYILVSASIYTNSLLKKNPLHDLEEKYNINPATFSFAYLPTTGDDEKNMVFGCRTEDQTGTSDWGCVVVNRARFARRKLTGDPTKPLIALMDLDGEKDYIILLKQNGK